MDLRTGPLGPAQQFEWWKAQHPGPQSGTNNMLTVTPPPGFTVAMARRALDLIVARHESLRTTFDFAEDATPRQFVHPAAPVEVRLHRFTDERACAEFRETVRWHEFALETELPVLAGLIVTADGVRDIVMCMPHPVVDGWSRRILIRELTEVVDALARGRDPRLPPAAQPLDAADSMAGADAAAFRFWTAEYGTVPNRLFAPHPATPASYASAEYSSALGSLVLGRAAQRDRIGPWVIYMAALHAVLACMSGTNRSVLATHVPGRDGAMENVVGCFHRILPLTVDMSDRPPLSEIIRRTWTKTLRIQSRQLDYLRLRAAMAHAEGQRGIAFAQGTTVNFAPGREDTADIDDPSLGLPDLLALAARPTTTRLHHFDRTETIDRLGLESYLQIRFPDKRMTVTATFNEAVFPEPRAMMVLSGPERLLLRYLERGDVAFDEVGEVVGTPFGGSHDPDVVRIDADIVRCSEVAALLRRHPDVADARVEVRPAGAAGQRLTAYVTPAAPGLDVAELREFVLAGLTPAVPVACPGSFVVAGTPPGEPIGRPAAGDGRERCTRALVDAISALGAGRPELDTTFLDAGGQLIKIPAVLRRLAALGYGGLVPDDFTRPVPLRVLAAMVAPS